MPTNLPQKIIEQMRKVGLPTGGSHPFEPRLTKNQNGEPIIEKRAVGKGPKRGKARLCGRSRPNLGAGSCPRPRARPLGRSDR